MSKALLIKTLRELRFLHDIAAGHLEHLADIAELKDFSEQEILFREGDPANFVYMIVEGSVSVEICSPGIGCKRILTVGPGELLGWSPLLEQSRLTATARADSPTRTVEINGGKLLTICESDPRFGYEIMRRTALALAKRLSATRMQLLDVYGSQMPPVAQSSGS